MLSRFCELCECPPRTRSLQTKHVHMASPVLRKASTNTCRWRTPLTLGTHPSLLPPYYVPPEITQVETSSNMAAVTPVTNGAYEILCSSRSSLGPSLAHLRRKIKTTAELCGASHVNIKPPYPGWKPDLESHVLKVGGGDDDDFSFSCRVGCSLWGSRARASLLGSVPRPQLCTGLACALSMRAKTVSCFV